jgi:hypothetical protein
MKQRLHAAGICDCCDAPPERDDAEVLEQKNEILDGFILVLSEHSTEHLREVADSCEEGSWMAKMILEYVDVWR